MQTELFNDDCGKCTKSWGMPWMGSKSDIAWQVVNAIHKGCDESLTLLVNLFIF